jgi:hypothetical protein
MLRSRKMVSRICLAVAISSAAGLYALRQHRRVPASPVPSDRDVSTDMRIRARKAIETAAKEFHTVLDFSPESVEKVETILEQIHQRQRQSPLSQAELVRESMKWGAYIGETIKAVRPCRWALNGTGNGEGSLPVVYEDKGESYPVLWCYNRITNGDEDNVWHKFRILVLDRVKAGSVESPSSAVGVKLNPE